MSQHNLCRLALAGELYGYQCFSALIFATWAGLICQRPSERQFFRRFDFDVLAEMLNVFTLRRSQRDVVFSAYS